MIMLYYDFLIELWRFLIKDTLFCNNSIVDVATNILETETLLESTSTVGPFLGTITSFCLHYPQEYR